MAAAYPAPIYGFHVHLAVGPIVAGHAVDHDENQNAPTKKSRPSSSPFGNSPMNSRNLFSAFNNVSNDPKTPRQEVSAQQAPWGPVKLNPGINRSDTIKGTNLDPKLQAAV